MSVLVNGQLVENAKLFLGSRMTACRRKNQVTNIQFRYDIN